MGGYCCKTRCETDADEIDDQIRPPSSFDFKLSNWDIFDFFELDQCLWQRKQI